MGELAAKYFQEAAAMGGIAAKVRLAAMARLTSSEAEVVEDTQDLLLRLDNALGKLREEWQRSSPPERESVKELVGDVVSSVSQAPEAIALRKHLTAYAELMSQRALVLSSSETTFRRIDEASSTALDVERVSVWFLDDAQTKITCADLFERATRTHSSGVELFAKDYGAYFAALGTQRTIAAHDARKDPRTSCFAEGYLAPLGITSMLDVPVWLGNKMVGVICHEHVGPKRRWNSDEETFAYLMSSFVSLVLERERR